MPARDLYHAVVRNALVKDGWTITHDPYTLSAGRRDLFVDLGAEMPIAAEKAGRQIAVEVKGFSGPSDVRDLEVALGQYVLYQSLMARADADRALFLAVAAPAYEGILTEEVAQPALQDYRVNLVVFDPAREVIIKWIPSPNGEGSSAR